MVIYLLKMNALSVEKAQDIIKDVQISNGGVSSEVWKGLPKDQLQALRNLQTIAGSSIEHVAKDLYDTDTRFIFELIQNAEDNHYTVAEESQSEPFLHFTLHQDCLTVDSNEDGFTEADVRAICSIHQSSKKQVGGYIGHKGIGFKSVFKIAYKVCVQSGPFSFYFEHQRGDGGLAMITPYNQAPQELPCSIRTRITLWLLDSNDFPTRARELEDIPDTLLLFLRKLRKLTIEIPALKSRVTYERDGDTRASVTILRKQSSETVKNKFYYMQKQTLTGLPADNSRQMQHEADLVLAFPLDESFRPVIEPQFVYSFLPMRKEGFNFLIQSDFITQANRQGIHLCPRNYAIRQEICNLFVKAAKYFCTQPALAHEWLQYLPNTHIYDRFWAELRDMIFKALKETEVLFAFGDAVLKRPVDLHNLSTSHCDRHGKPLLEDLQPAVYLSQTYSWARHAECLWELGVTCLPVMSFLDRLVPYLQGNRPRYLDPGLDEDWHTKIARLLACALKRRRTGGQVHWRIMALPLIPAGGTLTAAGMTELYFPDDDQGNPIPEDLKKIQLVDRQALENHSRMELFKLLGVRHCKSDFVIKAVLRRYDQYGRVTLNSSVSHLRYLFKALGKDSVLDRRIFIMDEKETPVYRAHPTFGISLTKDDLYFETLGEYGTKSLAQLIADGPRFPNTPKPEMHLIHSAYSRAVPAGTLSHGCTWEQWLQQAASVRRFPRLKHRETDRLSDLAAYLARYRPMSLVFILKENWKSYAAGLTPNVIALLKEMRIDCGRFLENHLKYTYYPSKEMRRLATNAGLARKFPYFLGVPFWLESDDGEGWEFLSNLGVTIQPTIEFFFDVIQVIVDMNELESQGEAAFFYVYKELSKRFSDEHDELRRYFENYETPICIPKAGQRSTSVLDLEDCFWNGDPCLSNALAQYPQYANDPHVAHLFKNVLRVPDADLFAYLSEIEFVKTAKKFNPLNIAIDDLAIAYELVAKHITSSEDSDSVRQRFDRSSLIYLPVERRWLAPKDCLWTETPKIGAQFGISKVYPELEGFFCNHLKVSTPTAATYITQLRAFAAESPVDIVKIKTTLYKLSSVELDPSNREDLLDLKVFPVVMPGGPVEVLKPTVTLFIADRIEHRSAFQDKVPFLDFSLREIRKLHPLLVFLGLQERYTSVAVKERTVVQDPAEGPSSAETRAFRSKSRHIHRCVLHYSATIQETNPAYDLEQLEKATVYLSRGFSTTLELQLNEVAATVQSDLGLVHISGSNGLRIYIPSNPTDSRRCYSLYLPQALVGYFGLRDAEASLMLQLVFATPKDFIDDLLDTNGISGGYPEAPEPQDEETQDLSIGQGTSEHEDNDTPDDGTITPRSSDGSEERAVSHHRPISSAHRPITTDYPQETHPSPAASFVLDDYYIQVLDHTIELARQLPFREALRRPETTGQETISHQLAFGVRSDGQIEHDMKIGAAGELFVFELLQRLSLPGFTRTNWRSTIRRKVSDHPEYRDLVPWNGTDTAGIVYDDTSSAFTRTLVDMGLLRGTAWLDATPTYYIEVKTTTDGWSDAFFMSEGQYRRMENMKIGRDPHVTKEIYIIFRVYNLGKENTRARVYVDPESLREEGDLLFYPESYKVSPGLLETRRFLS
ncbi:hypothetical protein BDW69DRAFT_26786 [Aspergillus filifer]